MSTDPSRTAETTPTRLRADAQRNRERVLQAAKDAFSFSGFETSYHDIAKLAQVGVGTVYRRYPERAALLEAVLLDIVDELTTHAVLAATEKDSWHAFEKFFDKLADTHRRYAGMSQLLTSVPSSSVQTARRLFGDKLQALCTHTWRHGLRKDVGAQELIYVAGLFASRECELAGNPGSGWTLAIRVVLDGLRQ